MQFRLILDRDQLEKCRRFARDISENLSKYTTRHTSAGVERATLAAMGVHGQHAGRPLVELVVEKIGKERLRDGAGYWLGFAMWDKKCDAQAAAQHIAKTGLSAEMPKGLPHGEIKRLAKEASVKWAAAADKQCSGRDKGENRRKTGGQVFAAIATADARKDLDAIGACIEKGVDGIVLRSPLKPEAEQLTIKTGGWRGYKYDTLVVIGKACALTSHRRLIVGGNSLCAPELAVASTACAPFDIEYDAITLAKQGGVHIKRALVDQYFVFRILARTGTSIHLSSDSWGLVVDGYQNGHEIIAGMMLIEALGAGCGLELDSIGYRHAPIFRNGNGRDDKLALEIAHAQLLREMFPQVEIGFTTHIRNNDGAAGVAAGIARVSDYSYCLVDGVTGEKASLGNIVDAVQKVASVNTLMGGIVDDITFVANGKVMRRTHTLLDQVTKLLQHYHRRDFLKAVAEETHGLFAIPDTGTGLDGVIQKGKYYWSPVLE